MTRFVSGYWLLVPLLLFAILVRNWVEAPETLLPLEPLVMQDIRADYYLEEFTTRRFDDAGQLEYVLTGETLSHYPADDRAEIVSPRVRMRDAGTIWAMSASGGRFTRGPDVVTLLDDVVLERTSSPRQGSTGEQDVATHATGITLRTSNLRIALDSRDVSTVDPLVIESAGMRLSAVGLQSSMQAGKLELLSNVTGRYEVAPESRDADAR